jgi:K(+)-stimulated pyrophosphate-energized sodium pump
VGRSAGVVVQEVRRQFADGKIMRGEKRPDYGPVIDICTAASLRELATPALLAVLSPVIIGFGISYLALGAFLAAVILTGQLMAVYLSNSGGAWDNAKKYIEDGHEGGKGSEAHKAAVIGDTVGDPFKDTAGPALNPLIKVMNLISLLTLPAIISLKDNDGARFAISGVALAVLVAAVLFSKRKGATMASEQEDEFKATGAPLEEPPLHWVTDGDLPMKLAIDALDRWIMDLGDEEHQLRKQLRAARSQLTESQPSP